MSSQGDQDIKSIVRIELERLFTEKTFSRSERATRVRGAAIEGQGVAAEFVKLATALQAQDPKNARRHIVQGKIDMGSTMAGLLGALAKKIANAGSVNDGFEYAYDKASLHDIDPNCEDPNDPECWMAGAVGIRIPVSHPTHKNGFLFINFA